MGVSASARPRGHYVEQPRRKTQRVETEKIPFETMEASPPVINLSVGTLLQAKDRIGTLYRATSLVLA